MSTLSRFLSLRRPNTNNRAPDSSSKSPNVNVGVAGSGPVNAYTTLTPEEHPSVLSKALKDIKDLVRKDLPVVMDPTTVGALLDVIQHKDSIDDRKMALEQILMIMANMPADAPYAKKLQNSAVMLLYNDLSHPPATFVGPQYSQRTADGSYNNVMLPDLGKSGSPYSRSVQQVNPLPQHILPDPNLVFDCLLKRDKFKPHPAGLSSLMFAFAALVIHTCFRTSHEDWNTNETSSYVDLTPLYGVNMKQQAAVRAFDGYGNLLPDTFAEDRLLLLPPAVCAILVLFSRNHNYIARHLLEINERGKWVDPSTLSRNSDEFRNQDEDLFQTARLINCFWFAQAVFSDYLAAILGFSRLGIRWSLNPFEEIRASTLSSHHALEPRGQGNAVSAEFNCLYRWHATTSREDEEWIKMVWTKFFGGRDPGSVTPDEFRETARMAQKLESKAEAWTFGGLKRGTDNRFADADLAHILQDATSHHAGAFGARHTPEAMRLNEVMGIQQSRRWGVCSLNDFRRFLGLKPYSTFLEWNPDPDVADAASKLYYGDIENLELYVGLQAEEAKPVIDGAGLCPGYTISRAILADAISLTRGDRFYTTDLTPANYTAWGLRDASRDVSNPGFGSTLSRLMLRHLPGEFSADSAYVWFPLMQPGAMRGFCEKLGIGEKYDFEKPGEGAKAGAKDRAVKVHVLKDYHLVKGVLGDKAFESKYHARAQKIVKGNGFICDPASLASAKPVLDALFGREGSVPTAAANGPAATKPGDAPAPTETVTNTASSTVLATRLRELVFAEIERDAFRLSGALGLSVDISAVFKCAVARWVAEDLIGIPLKTDDAASGIGGGEWSPSLLYDMLISIYIAVFMEPDPAKEMVRAEGARKNAEALGKAIHAKLRGHHGSGGGRLSVLNIFTSAFTSPSSPSSHNHTQTARARLDRVLETNPNVAHDDLTNMLLSVAVLAAAELAQGLIVGIADSVLLNSAGPGVGSLGATADADEKILVGCAREAWRREPVNPGLYRTATENKRIGEIDVQRGERVYLDVASANLNSKTFPEPESISAARPDEAYLVTDGILQVFGPDLVYALSASALRALFSLRNVKRTPGPSGQLKRFHWSIDGVKGAREYRYLDKNMDPIPWATSLLVQYDAPSQ